ncbi:hypothetical protein PHMEG_00031097 [Phytophthora megakarya]|uniref:SWIM-type domain-containing protein n=1 Tax=Phytophthora megakarya TaxID=4795 RepID=A0A225UXG4_9STRA|nr:hypothetical protein PHMEG_00031097 [Phytophthora megakarya]
MHQLHLSIYAQERLHKTINDTAHLGPLLSTVVSRAFVHVVEGAHYDYSWTENGKVTNRSTWFNSSKYRQKPDELPSHRVTETLVDRYLKDKTGEITKSCKVEDITLMYQSLHEVEFLKPAEQNTSLMLKLVPKIQLETVEVIHSLYRCDCKAFWNIGWLCSHVLAGMDLLGQFRLAQAISVLPTTKPSGGQRKSQGALNSDSSTSKTFTNGCQEPPANSLHKRVYKL